MRTKPALAMISALLLAQALDARTFRTQRTKVAAAATVEEVRIPSVAGVILAGTIRIPAGRGPHPVLIIQSGSGPSKRGGYLPLEHRLNRVGIATVEYDKRGVGQSTGAFADTMQNMEMDIEATIAWLRKRPDVDGARIALLGHSQGAAAAPEVAARDGHLAAVVFLAGPVGQRGTMFNDRMQAQLVESGHAPEAARRVVTATQSWMELRSRGAQQMTPGAPEQLSLPSSEMPASMLWRQRGRQRCWMAPKYFRCIRRLPARRYLASKYLFLPYSARATRLWVPKAMLHW